MKKLLLILVMALLLGPQVNAANDTMVAEIDETIGIIVDFDGDFLRLVGEALTANGYDEVMLLLGDAPVYDLITGLSVSATAINPGMEARVAYFYEPEFFPQTVTVWLHPTHENAAVFTASVSDNIQYGSGYCVFLSADGRYRITLTDDIFIYDPIHGVLTSKDIEPGQMFFAWVDMITASSPALVYPDKIVLIPH